MKTYSIIDEHGRNHIVMRPEVAEALLNEKDSQIKTLIEKIGMDIQGHEYIVDNDDEQHWEAKVEMEKTIAIMKTYSNILKNIIE